MDLRIVNPQPRYGRVQLIEPPPLGYIQVAAAVEPPSRGPLPGRSVHKRALLANPKSLARRLENLETVAKATVYRAIVVPPPAGYAKEKATHVARYDVVVLIETTSPEVIDEVQRTEPYKLLLEAVGDADYVFVNHARWDTSLPTFMVRQMAKPSFFNYMLANLRANRTGAMPLLYQLA